MGYKALYATALTVVLLVSQPHSAVAQGGGASEASTNIYLQLQEMQYELRELRGLVEELNHEVKNLRQRQIDDYQDLDGRLSGTDQSPQAVSSTTLSKTGTPQGSTTNSSATESPALENSTTQGSGNQGSENQSSGSESSATSRIGSAVPANSSGDSELDSYNTAYEMLKNRQIDDATRAFKTHLQRYPQGQYAANSHYWLGEIYLLKNDLNAAEAAFTTVVNTFADDRKAPDAMFKLGRVYHMQGQTDKARQMFNRVSGTDSSAAALARTYLQENM